MHDFCCFFLLSTIHVYCSDYRISVVSHKFISAMTKIMVLSLDLLMKCES